MNDQQFHERAHANPHDDSAEFLQAVAESDQRQQLVAELKRFDDELKSGLESVSAPASLKQALLDIPDEPVAANDSYWRKYSAIAATVIIAIGIAAIMLQSPADSPMEDMVFSHIYSELPFLEDETPVSLDDVNTLMVTWVGSDFTTSEDMQNLKINFMKDCWVDFANGVQGFHLIMKGDAGPVTVMVIPNSPLEADVAISDERFVGLIHPTSGGNLVVVGEKEEPIEQFSSMLAANINW